MQQTFQDSRANPPLLKIRSPCLLVLPKGLHYIFRSYLSPSKSKEERRRENSFLHPTMAPSSHQSERGSTSSDSDSEEIQPVDKDIRLYYRFMRAAHKAMYVEDYSQATRQFHQAMKIRLVVFFFFLGHLYNRFMNFLLASFFLSSTAMHV